MGLRLNKIQRLQEQQEDLRRQQSDPFSLRNQQEALRRSLLLRKPVFEDKSQRFERLRESQRVERDLHLKREREEKERKRVIERLRKENLKVKISNGERLRNLFFPQIKRRRR